MAPVKILALDAEAPNQEAIFGCRATLRNSSGRPVWSADHLTVSLPGALLVVEGDYSLTIEGPGRDGQASFSREYRFRVIPSQDVSRRQ